MDASQREKYEKEIKTCKGLYQGFAEAEDFIAGVFQAIFQYYEQRETLEEPLNIDFQGEEIEEKLREGRIIKPNPRVKTDIVVDLLNQLGMTVAEANPDFSDAVKDLNSSLQEFVANSRERISKEEVFLLKSSLVEDKVLEKDMATFLFSLALSSEHKRYLASNSAGPRRDLWKGGNCPLCGENPHFGMLHPETGAKNLECWLCGIQWVHDRIKCPFCHNQEQEKLGYFTAEKNEICRVHFCKECRKYYKLIDVRKLESNGHVVLTVHNLASLSYDLLAKEEGFEAGSGLEWVKERDRLDL